MQQLIEFLREELQKELPHSNIYNENLPDKLVQFIIAAEKAAKVQFAKKPPRICAVMIALYEEDGEVYLPMMLRPTNSRAHPGQIAFPGGKAEEEDIDLIETAVREMEEEIGVWVNRENIIGELSPVYIPPSNALVTPIVGFLESKPKYIPDPAEVAEVFAVRLDDLLNPDNISFKKVILASGEYIQMPAYHANGKVIWGGTARMISELVKMVTLLV
ncbi:MAG: NUDIX domain-containing protein [Chitinophagales bacterium]